MIPSVVDAVRDEIKKLPDNLQNSGLAAAAISLANQLELASSRDCAGIARELRTTLATLREMAGNELSEENPIESLRKANSDL